MNNRLKLIVIIVALAAVIGAGIYSYINHTSMRLTASEPTDGRGTTTNSIIFTFNHDLDSTNTTHFTISPYIDGSASVSRNQLIFKPTYSYQINTKYTATVSSPTSTTGLVGKAATITFTAQYIPEGEQSKQQRQDALDKNDNLPKLALTLPKETLDYRIDYTQAGDNNQYVYTITLYAVINGPQDRPQYEQELKQYKQEALDYIKSQNIDPSTLTINYVPSEAANY